MARNPFKASETEALAIQSAELKWRTLQEAQGLLQRADSTEIVQLKARCSALQRDLGDLVSRPSSGNYIELICALRNDCVDRAGSTLPSSKHLSLDFHAAELQTTLEGLTRLCEALSRLAPPPGQKTSAKLASFVFIAADQWQLDVGQRPTPGGRFHKAIGDIAKDARLQSLSSKSVSAALAQWEKARQ